MFISKTYNRLFRPEKLWEVKLQIVTQTKALVEVKVKEKARSNAEAKKKAIESVKKMIGVVVVEAHQVKK